jgi:hypothetical protein
MMRQISTRAHAVDRSLARFKPWKNTIIAHNLYHHAYLGVSSIAICFANTVAQDIYTLRSTITYPHSCFFLVILAPPRFSLYRNTCNNHSAGLQGWLTSA